MSLQASAAFSITDGSRTAAASARPTPSAARMVQLSCQRLATVQTEFAHTLRSTLYETVPGMRGLSAASATALCAGLAHCVLWAALTQDPPETVEATLRRVGADHYRQGLPDDSYLGIGRALMRSARDTLDAGWDSRLSSAWVDYCQWLDVYLRIGADLARAEDGGTATGARPGPAAGGAGGYPAGRELSLDEIFQYLREAHFAANERGLAAVCTRVMLRTGADLRSPRPDQNYDPTVIAHVNESLLLMGFAPAPAAAVPARLTEVTAPRGRSRPGDGTDQPGRQQRRRRWWGWQRTGDAGRPASQLPAAPGGLAGPRR